MILARPRLGYLSPDGYVVFGVPARTDQAGSGGIYRIDEWGPPPAFVMEVGSDSTAARDMREKREIYARMGAQEYWRFDPSGGERYGEPLIGERLVDGEYERFETQVEGNGGVWVAERGIGRGLLLADWRRRARWSSWSGTARRASGWGI